MSAYRVHFAELGSGVLCREQRWYAADTNKDNVTCRRCLYLLGLYMPTDPERREELVKRQEELTRSPFRAAHRVTIPYPQSFRWATRDDQQKEMNRASLEEYD